MARSQSGFRIPWSHPFNSLHQFMIVLRIHGKGFDGQRWWFFRPFRQSNDEGFATGFRGISDLESILRQLALGNFGMIIHVTVLSRGVSGCKPGAFSWLKKKPLPQGSDKGFSRYFPILIRREHLLQQERLRHHDHGLLCSIHHLIRSILLQMRRHHRRQIIQWKVIQE